MNTYKAITLITLLVLLLVSCKPTAIYFESTKPLCNEEINIDYWHTDTLYILGAKMFIDTSYYYKPIKP